MSYLDSHRFKNIGVSVLYPALNANTQYQSTVLENFSHITPENAMKFEVLHPDFGSSSYTESDFIVNWARENKLDVRGHPIIWHRQIPAWLKEKKFEKTQFREIFDSHILDLVTRYKDQVQAWDVVNEAVNSDGSYRKSIWLKQLGPSYIKDAFILAHHANPKAKLFYNDYDISKPGPKSDAVYDLLKSLLAIKVPIHGIGFQMHLRPDFMPSEEDIRNVFRKFSELGLDIHITELDIALPLPASIEVREEQKATFEMIARICNEVEACKLLSLWGLHDGASWIPSHFKGLGEATLFDAELRPKEGFQSFKSRLGQKN